MAENLLDQMLPLNLPFVANCPFISCLPIDLQLSFSHWNRNIWVLYPSPLSQDLSSVPFYLTGRKLIKLMFLFSVSSSLQVD
jgi:hypothetical protein